MANETVIVVHPFGDYCAELDPHEAEFTEFVPWAELTTDEQFVHEAGVPADWAQYLGTGAFEHGMVVPIGLGKLSARAVEGDRNYTEFMNPVFKRVR